MPYVKNIRVVELFFDGGDYVTKFYKWYIVNCEVKKS